MKKRIIVATLLSVVVILLSLGVISNLSVHNTIEHSLQDRLQLAEVVANFVDNLLERHLTRLYDISLSGAVDFGDGDWEPEKKALETAYQYSIFTDGIFLLDMDGNVVLTYPPSQIQKTNLKGIPYVKKTLDEKKPVISNIYTEEEKLRKVIYVLVPLKDKDGNTIGAAGGEINPTSYVLNNLIKAVYPGEESVIELVDGNGMVITANNQSRVFAISDHNKVISGFISEKKKAVIKCHRCHEDGGAVGSAYEDEPRKTTDILAFSPLSGAPWGIAIRESEKQLFAPSSYLKRVFFILGIISIGSALLLAIGMSRSIVNPVNSLIAATKQITKGNLKSPITVASKDEIGILGESFESMRVRLSESLDELQRYNEELEERVAKRTRELQQSRKRLENMLQVAITAQEDERMRIARELHDETSQSIAALGMSLDIASMALGENKLAPESLRELREKVGQLLVGINRLIQNLRPPVLDDLGLESAVRWLLERHFAGKGIKYELNTCEKVPELISGNGSHMDKKIELTLFRVIQEAVVNISKHSNASNVSVVITCKDSRIEVRIEDDGVGFDLEEVIRHADMNEGKGFGLLGLRERVSLLDGTLQIHSKPGEGTSITVDIPVSHPGVKDV
jgi:signal transduction histidine kinase